MGRPAQQSRSSSKIVRDLFSLSEESKMKLHLTADDLKVGRKTLLNWKAGRHAPSILDIEAFADLLGLELKLTPKE